MKKNHIRNKLRIFIFSLIRKDLEKLIDTKLAEFFGKSKLVENKSDNKLMILPSEFYPETDVIDINKARKQKELTKMIKEFFNLEDPNPPKSVA